MIQHIRYGVVLNDANTDDVSPSLTFDCISGVTGDGVYETVERLVEAGTIVGAIVSEPQSFDQTVTLYRVEESGLNKLDDQPAKGDFIVSVCPPNDITFQAGMFAVVVDDDGHVATISIGLLLTLFPLFAQDWMAQVPAMLGEALNVLNIPARIDQAVSNALGADPAPTPDPDPAPAAPPVAAPSNVTPTEDWTWDGTDNVLCSADTSNQPITVFVPPAEDTDEVPATDDQPAVPARKVINHTLIVHNRNGAENVTVAINAAEDHQGDIIVPPGHVATIRAISGSYVLTSWL